MENPLLALAYFPLQTLAAVVSIVQALAVGVASAEPATVLPESAEPPRAWTSNVLPAYPAAGSTTTEDEVTVRLAVVVDRDGSVLEPKVLDGAEPFATAALKAVKRWHYEPARDGGRAIAVPWQILVRFELPPKARDRWHVYRRPRPTKPTLIADAASR